MIDLNDRQYRKNVNSQHGEDGIIEVFLKEAKIALPYFCEFGAHDSLNSNFWELLNQGFPGVFIEPDKARFQRLEQATGQNSLVTLINDFVLLEHENRLEPLLRRNAVNPKLVNLVSIDVDSIDAAIFKEMEIRPDLVIIEYNPTIPFDVDFIQPVDAGQIGNSALALLRIARQRGMYLAAITETNLIFLDSKYRHIFRELDLASGDAVQPSQIRYAFSYDGELMRLSRSGAFESREYFGIGWSSAILFQPLPKGLRKFEKYGFLKVLFSFWVLLVTRPWLILVLLKEARLRYTK